MTINSIGRLVFLKYCALSTVLFPALVISVLWVIYPTGESIGQLLLRALKALLDNSIFLFVELGFILTTIWIFGGTISSQIVHKKRSPFLVGGLTFLTLWLFLFLTSALTSATIDAVQMYSFYFRITFSRWINYHFIPFLVIGVIHGLCIGFLFGREIKKKEGD
jgi:hypothetical protein